MRNGSATTRPSHRIIHLGLAFSLLLAGAGKARAGILSVEPDQAEPAVEKVLRLEDGSYIAIHADGSVFGFTEFTLPSEVPGDTGGCGSRGVGKVEIPAELAEKMARYRAMANSLADGGSSTSSGIMPAVNRAGDRGVHAGPLNASNSGMNATQPEFDFCDITVGQHSYSAHSCAPDCHGDCDEGHDGSTCHAHSYFPLFVGTVPKATWIKDFVDCCECSTTGTGCSQHFISPSNCGLCASDPGVPCQLPWQTSLGRASCCVVADDLGLLVKLKGQFSPPRHYPQRTTTIHPGDSGTLENRVLVKSGGKESCNSGSADGWHFGSSATAWQPDRSVETEITGTYANYSWTGTLPNIAGVGVSYVCGTLPDCDPNDPFCFE